MQHRTARNVVSALMALVLVFTCNSAAFQPLAMADAIANPGTGSVPPAERGEGQAGRAQMPQDVPDGGEEPVSGADASAPLVEQAGEDPTTGGGAEVEAFAGAEGSIVGMPPLLAEPPAPLPAAGGAVDVTDDRDQLDLELVRFSYVDAGGAERKIEPNESGQYDFSSVSVASIAEMRMEIDFSILKNDAARSIGAGDEFRFSFPGELFLLEDNEAVQEILSPAGEVIATYTIEDNIVVVVFAQAVDIDEGNVDIVGGVDCSFELNVDGLNDDEPTSADMQLQAGGPVYTFIAPKKGSDLKGIEKTGVYNKDDCTVTWTVKVGTDPASAGIPLKGVTVADVYDATLQTEVGVYGPDGATKLDVDETPDGFSYTFLDDSPALAPYELVVKATVASGVLEAAVADDQVLSNTVTMTAPEGSGVSVAGDPSATGTVSVPKYGISKQGTPLNSSTMAWEIVVNEGGVGAAKDVVVYDRLDARATYSDGTLKVNGTSVTVFDSAPDPAPSGTYAVITAEDAGTHLLEVRFAGTVSAEQRITFETDIDTGLMEDVDVAFPNEAWITFAWPNGYGPDPSSFKPLNISTNFQVAYLNKETPSYNEHTGVIDWAIKPSARTEEYDKGTIADVINDDQEYVVGSVVVKNRGVELTSDELARVFSYDTATKTLSFTFERPAYSLNDIAIEYQSQAINFKNENMVDHVYEDSAHLGVYVGDEVKFQADDAASRSFRNEFLAKTSDYVVVDDNSGSTGYVHYRIVANGSQMPCTNLKLEDDLSALVAKAMPGAGAGTEKALGIDDFAIDADTAHAIKVTKTKGSVETDVTNSFDVSAWAANKKIVADFSADSRASYTVDLYLTLKKDVLLGLEREFAGSFSIDMSNTVSATADEFDGGTPAQVTCEGAAQQGGIGEQLVSKSSDRGRASDADDPYLEYRIDVNPNGACLEGVVLTDTFDPALAIDLSSVELYRAQHGAGGAISEEVGSKVADGWSKELVYDAAQARTVLRVALPDGTASYVVKYRARVVAPVKSGSVTNDASMTSSNGPSGSSTCVTEVEESSWGWLTKKAAYKLVKADEFGGKASPIAGVTFNLYDDEGRTNLVATAISNAQGIVAFYGLDLNKTYYYDEPKAASGYQTLAFDAGSNHFTTGAAGSSVVAGEATLNKRTTSDVEVAFAKTFSDPGSLSGLQSEFKLWLYPNGFDNAKKAAVVVSGADGAYAFSDGAGPGETIKNKASGGTLTFMGLPWGCYGLEETNPQPGYAAYEGMRRFEVVRPADDASSAWSVNYDPFGTGAVDPAQIANEKTAISVAKTSPNGTSLAGATLAVYATDESGGKMGTVVTSPFDGSSYAATIPGDAGNSFTWDLAGLPAGTYVLSEDAAPADPELDRFEDVKFSVDVHGKARVESGPGTVANSTTIKVSDDVAKATLKKLDQFGVGVAGAVIELQKQGASEWETVEAWTTTAGETSKAFPVLRDTAYRFIETTAPAGYLPASDGGAGYESCIEFAIDAYGKMTVLDAGLHNPSGLGSGDKGYGNAADAGEKAIIMRNERIVGQASFEKRDSSTAAMPLEGAQFDLYRVGAQGDGSDDAKVNQDGRFASGSDGTVTTVGSQLTNALTGEAVANGLAPGAYYFKEVQTRDDFALPAGDAANTPRFVIEADGSNRYTWCAVESNGPKHVVPVYNADAEPAAMANAPLAATVVVNKVGPVLDAGDQPLPGAAFRLSGTTASGKTYERTVETASQDATLNWEDSNGGAHVASVSKGQAAFVNVPTGSYTVVETAPASGYVLDATSYQVTVDADAAGTTYAVGVDAGDGRVVRNEPTSVQLDKVDNASSPQRLDGAKLVLSGAFADGTAERKWVSGQEAWTLEGLLIVGETYTLTEEEPLDGFLALPGAVAFKLTGTGAVELEQNPAYFDGSKAAVLSESGLLSIRNMQELSFAKAELYAESCSDASLGADGADATRPLAGAGFTVYENVECTTIAKAVGGANAVAQSSADGVVLLPTIEAGTYYVKETKVPDAHISDGVVYQLVVAADGTMERFASVGEAGIVGQVVNDVVRTDISIKKVSETDPSKTLPDSTYGLYRRISAHGLFARAGVRPLSPDQPLDSSLQLVAKAMTDADGMLTFKGILMDQEYVIQELAAPDGSLVSKNPIVLSYETDEDGAPRLASFDDGSGTAEVDANGTVVWKEPQVTIRIDKKSPEGGLLAGAKLRIVDAAGAPVVGPWTSADSEGRVVEGELVAGKTYRLQELEAPEGYLKAEDVSFTVEDPRIAPGEAHTQHVEMVDELVRDPAGGTVPPTRGPQQQGGILGSTGDPLASIVAVIVGAALCAACAAGAATAHRRRRR